MEIISYKDYQAILKACGVTYFGGIKHSAKMMYSFEKGTLTYCLYLAPWNTSGYQVCPFGINCHKHCLNGSGRNKGDIIAHGFYESNIMKSRIKKTRFFYEHRQLFMQAVVRELYFAKQKAEREGFEFSVRLNGTSDIDLRLFKLGDKNILELFPNVQFYDYTKVPNRLTLGYSNYDLTFSFDGYNWERCEEYLKNGGKVAVVFENELPTSYKGFEVIDANGYDMRYIDPNGCICGLHYHRTANDYVNGKYVHPTSPFVVKEDDADCVYNFETNEIA